MRSTSASQLPVFNPVWLASDRPRLHLTAPVYPQAGVTPLTAPGSIGLPPCALRPGVTPLTASGSL